MSSSKRIIRAVSPSKAQSISTTLPVPKTSSLSPKPKSEKKSKPQMKVTLPPPYWKRQYELIKQMRSQQLAPVDTMGCDQLADRQNIDPKTFRLQILIGLMLSSQTKDAVTANAMKRLKGELPGGLTLVSLQNASVESIDLLINKVGFHNRKAQYIKNTADILATKFNGDIPDTIEGLTSLPGVGPKMAYLALTHAFGKTEGIGVDVHVHRLTNLLGWHSTATEEQTRLSLQSWLPRDLWSEINHQLVGFGQTICLPRGPKCTECLLKHNKLCPKFGPIDIEDAYIPKKDVLVVKKEENLIFKEEIIPFDNQNRIKEEEQFKFHDEDDVSSSRLDSKSDEIKLNNDSINNTLEIKRRIETRRSSSRIKRRMESND